jgi:hypothetical protein
MTHPITPPPELVQQWVQATESNDCIGALPTNFEQRICIAAAQWGADQELEACCALMDDWGLDEADLRAARRLKPKSLKELALAALNESEDQMLGPTTQEKLIRRALEALPE